MKAITNLEAGSHSARAVCLSCNCDGFRYHAWLPSEDGITPSSNVPEGGVLFKRSAAQRGEPEYFDNARKLDATIEKNELLVMEMIRLAHSTGVFETYKKKKEKEAADHDAALKESRRLAQIENAAEDLYEALKTIVAELEYRYDGAPDSPTRWMGAFLLLGKEAIAEANKEKQS